MLLKKQADTPPAENTQSPLRYLKGIGPKRAQALEKLGIKTPRDLLYFFPWRYEDRSQFKKIAELSAGEAATIRAEVLAVNLKRIRRFTILEVKVGDESGLIPCVWFNQPYLKDHFIPGHEVILFGKVNVSKEKLQLNTPEFEILDPDDTAAPVHTARVTPIYPLTEGLYQRSLRSTLYELVNHQLDSLAREYMPAAFLDKYDFMPLLDAIKEMHFPSSLEAQAIARKRLAFDELFLFELSLLGKMEQMKTKYRAPALSSGSTLEDLKKSLPFQLTAGQNTAIEEILKDLSVTVPMNRLLQGDVGSGKTVVAAGALLAAARNKKQGAILVPTEILAEQHYQTLSALMEKLDVPVALLTSSTPAAKREKIIAELKQGKLKVIVGTHAILQDDVKFQDLALVIIDEQHKFGVHQRCKLLDRMPRPHQLVMTATPIPRTLALTVYGDLATSVLKELPAGRRPIKTYWITRLKQKLVWEHIREKCEKGEQAYIIFPLIEETEKIDLRAAVQEYDLLRKSVFKNLKVGLVHGKIDSKERDALMRKFARNEIQILVATSVIEVGVNNPNATMMVIENAERFGLAQLHQMRGRIGRGDKDSECYLFGEPKTEEGQRRLRILTKSQDGFFLAEEDLKLRGPGDFWGTRQSGVPFFKVANPIEDENLLLQARKEAHELISARKLDTDPEWSGVKKFLEQFPVRY